MKKVVLGVVLILGISVPARQVSAQWAVFDASSLAEAVLQLKQVVQLVTQGNEIMNTAHTSLQAFRDAYAGLKDWKHLGWVDTLQILQLPWLDGVDGIDDIRNVATLSVMSAGQIDQLWSNLNPDSWQSNPRYRNDPWYRNKVNSLLRQSKRARATRAALMRQMQSHNQSLTTDIAKLKALRDKIQDENENPSGSNGTVDSAKIASLQAEIKALEAKHQGEGLQMANQRAIMMMVGQDDAQRVYLETRDRGWIDSNDKTIQAMGQAIIK
jgi:hypothetical protein